MQVRGHPVRNLYVHGKPMRVCMWGQRTCVGTENIAPRGEWGAFARVAAPPPIPFAAYRAS